MPDGHETYNSPVLHTDKNGGKYVLVGTGGETVAGKVRNLVPNSNKLFNMSYIKFTLLSKIIEILTPIAFYAC